MIRAFQEDQIRNGLLVTRDGGIDAADKEGFTVRARPAARVVQPATAWYVTPVDAET